MYESGTHKQCASFRNTIFRIPSGTDTLDFSDNSVLRTFSTEKCIELQGISDRFGHTVSEKLSQFLKTFWTPFPVRPRSRVVIALVWTATGPGQTPAWSSIYSK